MTAPKISFVVPAYNEEKRLGACLGSIINAARDTSSELIVVDNASTDKTADIASAMGALVVPEPNKGLVRARQSGADIANGELLAFIDADAVMLQGWVEAAIENFENQKVVGASGPLRFYDTPGYVNQYARYFYKIARVFHAVMPTVQGGNFVIRKTAFEAMGGFDTSVEFWGEDTMTASLLSKHGKIVLDPAMVILTSGRRLLQDGLLKTTALYIWNYLAVSILHRPANSAYRDFR